MKDFNVVQNQIVKQVKRIDVSVMIDININHEMIDIEMIDINIKPNLKTGKAHWGLFSSVPSPTHSDSVDKYSYNSE